MIAVEHDKDHLFIHIATQYFHHDYRVMVPLTEAEGKELAHAIETELQEWHAERERKHDISGVCICLANLPVMAGCPVHDAGPYPGTVHSGR